MSGLLGLLGRVSTLALLPGSPSPPAGGRRDQRPCVGRGRRERIRLRTGLPAMLVGSVIFLRNGQGTGFPEGRSSEASILPAALFLLPNTSFGKAANFARFQVWEQRQRHFILSVPFHAPYLEVSLLVAPLVTRFVVKHSILFITLEINR